MSKRETVAMAATKKVTKSKAKSDGSVAVTGTQAGADGSVVAASEPILRKNLLSLSVSQKQAAFIQATAREVLFGGAAGGGKSYGQLIDALLFALKYPGSRQLILRRSFAELDKSLIRSSLSIYPRKLYRYNSQSHLGKFTNGSLIDFGYCANESDVYQYQSAEYDVVRFDELTHFTEFQYTYLISRVRGANGYPKQVKSSTNPGGIGHEWVKRRFVTPAPPNTVFSDDTGGTRVFIPSRVEDNRFLLDHDPDYPNRLAALPENQRRALLEGDWELFEGQYFAEFSYKEHVVDPFPIPRDWRRYRAIDYGLDRLVCLWCAVAPDGRVYVYRELCESDLIVSAAAEKIRAMTGAGEEIYATLAPPDLWHRSQESGKSKASLFAEHGIRFTRSSNDREAGWLSVKELLAVRGGQGPRLRIFRQCEELCRCLPRLQIDRTKPCDTMNEPHEITHAPDALRAFAVFHVRPNATEEEWGGRNPSWSDDMWEDYSRADDAMKSYLRRKWRFREPTEPFA